MPNLHNRKYLVKIRKQPRNKSTAAESTLWEMLKESQVGGYKFCCQYLIGSFVVDFYCPKLQLVLELDGEPHADLANITIDTEWDKFIESLGIADFRYENRWVYE